MNTIKTFRRINLIALAATLPALLALALLPAVHASAASVSPQGAVLSLSPVKVVQTAPAGQTAYHTYELQNLSDAPVTVYLAARNDVGWAVALSANVVQVPAQGAIKFQAKVAVPATTTSESVTTIKAQIGPSPVSNPVMAYWTVQAGPGAADPTPVPSSATN